MKISTKGVYAIESMIDLGYHSTEHVESIKNIAKRRNVSEKYLEQIIGKLRKAGLIESVRGAAGGYRLLKPAKDITVFEILNAVEGDLSPVECLNKESPDCKMECDRCPTRVYWKHMLGEILEVATKVTLEELIEKEQSLWLKSEPEYYI